MLGATSTGKRQRPLLVSASGLGSPKTVEFIIRFVILLGAQSHPTLRTCMRAALAQGSGSQMFSIMY